MNWIDEVLKRAEAATPGPWYDIPEKNNTFHPDSVSDHWICPQATLAGDYILRIDNIRNDDAQNADFIAHARQDVPELCARLKRAIEELRTFHGIKNQDGYTISTRALADELEAWIVLA